MLTTRSLAHSVCIISIYRIFTLKAGVISQDPSWDNVGVAIWSCIELNVSIIASTLPVLRPLIARLLPGIGLSSARNDRTTYLRYGSDSAAIRGGAGKSTTTGNRSNKMRSISTEELALKEMGPGVAAAGAGSMRPGSVHAAHASSGGPRSTGGFPKDEYDDSRIVRTMEILVDSHAR